MSDKDNVLGLPLDQLPAEVREEIMRYQANAKDDVKGMQPELPRIELIHQGACVIKIGADGPIVKEFEGIVVHNYAQNAWWERSIEDRDPASNGFPECYSMDGEHPVSNCEKPQAKACEGCPRNQYGTDRNGRGKACKNMRRLFIFIPGQEFPHVMNIPPTSLKLWGRYITGVFNEHHIRPRFVLTKFTATPAQTSDGTDFTKLSLSMIRKVSAEELVKVMKIAPACEAYNRPVTQDDYMGTGEEMASGDGKAPF
jgi:hypothetical protein